MAGFGRRACDVVMLARIVAQAVRRRWVVCKRSLVGECVRGVRGHEGAEERGRVWPGGASGRGIRSEG